LDSVILGSYLFALSAVFALFFSYLLHQDKDKRRLMFLLVFIYSFLIRVPQMIPGLENTQFIQKIDQWGSLPIASAILIAAASSLLKPKDFSKPFKLFLSLMTLSTLGLILPFSPGFPAEIVYSSIGVATISILVYMVTSRRELPDLMFLLSAICFALAEWGRGAMNMETEFLVFSYTCAHMFLAFVFVTARESQGNGIASFFALEKELEKTKHELEISQQQLMTAEDNFRSLVNVIPDPVAIVDQRGKFLEINDKITEWTGFTKEELLGRNFMAIDIVTARSKAVLIKNLAKRMVGIKVKPYEIEVNRKNGEHLFFEVNAQKIEYQGKKADLVLFRDVTKRKMMEKKLERHAEHLENEVRKRTKTLREKEEKLRSIFDSSPDAIAVADLKGNVIECNKATLNLIGFKTKEELIGENSLLFVAEKDRKRVRQTIKNVLNSGPAVNVEYTALHKNGHEFPAEFSAGVVRDHSGKPTGFVTIIKDITERKRMENKLKQYSERLEELVEQRTAALKESQEQLLKTERLAAIGQAATMVGHDLRNPLQAIENGIYFINTELSKHKLPPAIKETLQAIHHSVDYADNIVKDLQSFASKRDPFLMETDINGLVEETFLHVKVSNNVKVISELNELPKIEVDKEMITRIFVNLATNGIQAMEEKGGVLRVSTRQANGFVEIKFEDSGVGIKKENIKKIFMPFFTTKAQGMGVGLAICKRFAELHRGSIEVESKEGKGSIFTVKLPIKRNGGAKFD